MKNKIKYLFFALFVVVLLGAYSIAQSTAQSNFNNENINNIRAIAYMPYPMSDYEEYNDSFVPYQLDVRYYINVTGEPTNTYTIYAIRERWSEQFNINSLQNFNKTHKNAIKSHAKELWNWTIPDGKILVPNMVQGSNI